MLDISPNDLVRVLNRLNIKKLDSTEKNIREEYKLLKQEQTKNKRKK